MADDTYLERRHDGARWAISRKVDGRWVHLVEGSPLESPGDAQAVLNALAANIGECIDIYFPYVEGKGRCPTLELLELCSMLDPTNPRFSANRIKDTVGV